MGHGRPPEAACADVDRAVAAARRAFADLLATSVEERIELIDRIIAAYERREPDLAQLIAQEVGVPVSFKAQVTGPAGHMKVARDLIRDYAFDRQVADTIVRREPIGVCALISPWNWPIQTSVIKVIYGIAAGCTVVLKPSDASPGLGRRPGRDPGRGGHAPRRLQPGHRPGQRRGRGPARPTPTWT